jgi:NitT/TauT family transport system substrate-binding protein
MKINWLGKIVFVLLILGLGGTAYYLLSRPSTIPLKSDTAVKPAVASENGVVDSGPSDEGLVETQERAKRLPEPGIYNPADNVVVIELSEYAGYAGLVAANGGLNPNDNSIFTKKYGFKLKINLSEAESWDSLVSGKIAAAGTTTDVLAAYGRQFQAVVPVQIGYSRGADGLVVRSNINKINDLKGKVLVTCQFTESDFLIRYLASEAGVPVATLANMKSKVDPESINLIFTEDGFSAGDFFLKDVQGNHNRIAGCVTWSPKTEEVVEAAKGKAKLLTTNRNLLVIADVLVVNKGFAEQNPKFVQGLVEGILQGNHQVRTNPQPYYDILEKSFKWEKGSAKAQLSKVHLANAPENLAFFSGEIDAAGSFDSIFNSAVLVYGSLVVDPVNAQKFVDTKHLATVAKEPLFAEQKVSISPIKMAGGSALEGNPLLSKNIRFLFNPNSSELDMKNQENIKKLQEIKGLLTVSPGSSILLRGHVDDGQKAEFAKGGDNRLKDGALRAMKLSLDRANEIKKRMVEVGIKQERIDTIGRGWEEPLGTNRDENRRVEVQWFTLE